MVLRDSYNTVDDYLKTVPESFRPLCEKLRKIIKEAVPKAEEVLRLGVPYYLYNGMLCSYTVYKKHVGLSLFRGGELNLSGDLFERAGKNLRTAKFADVKEVSSRTIRPALRAAAKLNESGVSPKKAPTTDASLVIPGELERSLARYPKARQRFDSLPMLSRREFSDWVSKAKHSQTRLRRAEEAALLLKEGKNLHGKSILKRR
ncbi:MAG: YdeI/OmpD-associated family protein [Chthoniobacterales bacterium]